MIIKTRARIGVAALLLAATSFPVAASAQTAAGSNARVAKPSDITCKTSRGGTSGTSGQGDVPGACKDAKPTTATAAAAPCKQCQMNANPSGSVTSPQ